MKRLAALSLSALVCFCGVAFGQMAPIGLPTLNLKDIGGNPAACLPAGEGPVSMQGAMVGAMDSDFPPNEWAIVLQDTVLPAVLKPGECVTYRQTLKGYAQKGLDKPLKSGETYMFTILNTDSEGHWATRLHVAVFCIEQRPDGSRKFLSYVPHEDGSGTYPACGKYIGWKPAPDGIIPPGYKAPDSQ